MNQSTILIFVACMIGALAIGIDFASVNLALPAIQSQFGIIPTLGILRGELRKLRQVSKDECWHRASIISQSLIPARTSRKSA
jgi:hypothetical protein